MTISLLFALVAGISVGLLLRRRQRFLQLVHRAAFVAILVLVLLLGIAVGADEVIMSNLLQLGLEAFILSLGAVAGSVLLVALLYRRRLP